MTKLIFRISYDDEQKLRPILETFGQHTFTISTVEQSCPTTAITSGDIKRWNSSCYIVEAGTTRSEKKYRHPITMWKLTDRVVTRLTTPPGRHR
jgi:hypothetical protein